MYVVYLNLIKDQNTFLGTITSSLPETMKHDLIFDDFPAFHGLVVYVFSLPFEGNHIQTIKIMPGQPTPPNPTYTVYPPPFYSWPHDQGLWKPIGFP